MRRLLSGILPLLAFCSAYAQNAQDPPPPTAPNIVGIVIFLVLFIGSCVGFFAYVWWGGKDKKKDGKPEA